MLPARWKAPLSVLSFLPFLLLAGCSAEESPVESPPSPAEEPPPLTGRTVLQSQPLVPFRVAPGLRIASEGELQMAWLDGGDGRERRAFVCSDDCAQSFRPPFQREVRFEATVRVESGERGAGGAARFAVVAHGWDGVPTTLFDQAVAAGSQVEVAAALPADVAGVELRVDHPGDAEGLEAIWLEPVLIGRRPASELAAGARSVLLVTADTTRPDELGAYGGPVATPNLDALAAEGAVFDDAHTVAFGTAPAHASLFTSSYASHHGVLHDRVILGDERPTLAELLAGQGWTTAAFVGSVVLNRASGLDRGFDLYDDSMEVERSGARNVALFERWLARTGNDPFFAWVHFFEPHQPYRSHGAAIDEDLAAVDAAIEQANIRETPGFIVPSRIAWQAPDLLDDVERVARARYREEIASVDAQLGRLRAALERAGRLEDTVVVFTSDHGESFLDRGADQAFRPAGIRVDVSRVPLLVRVPGGESIGRSPALAGSIDVAPTIASLLGVEPPEAWQGEPLLDSDGRFRSGARSHLFLESTHAREIGIRTADWFYRELRPGVRTAPRLQRAQGYAAGLPYELYARASDPGEVENLYEPDHEVLPGLREKIDGFEQGRPRPRLELQPDTEELRVLEAAQALVEDDEEPALR